MSRVYNPLLAVCHDELSVAVVVVGEAPRVPIVGSSTAAEVLAPVLAAEMVCHSCCKLQPKQPLTLSSVHEPSSIPAVCLIAGVCVGNHLGVGKSTGWLACWGNPMRASKDSLRAA
jgi:hypothetical protein